MNTLVLILVGASLALTSCQYPYAYNETGSYRGTFTPRHVTGGGLLGDLASSTLGSNRDHYYYVIRGANTGTRYYSARPYYTGPVSRPVYPVSYQLHPYYSNSLHSSPYYNRSSSYVNSYTHRPWGGDYGFGQPFSWGTGLGLGSRWY